MNLKSIILIFVLTTPLSLFAQDWVGIGPGVSHMEIEDSIMSIFFNRFHETTIKINQDSIGEFKVTVLDPDTGQDKHEALIEIFDNRDSISFKSIEGKVYETFYKGNKFKRKYPFRFHSIMIESYDPYNLNNRFEIRKYSRYDRNKYARFEYNNFNNNIRIEKEIGSEIIDSLNLLTQYLDIENINKDSCPFTAHYGHCCDISITITDRNYTKYQYIGARIPYHFRPIANLMRRLANKNK